MKAVLRLAAVYQCQLDIIEEKEEKRKETAEQSKQKRSAAHKSSGMPWKSIC